MKKGMTTMSLVTGLILTMVLLLIMFNVARGAGDGSKSFMEKLKDVFTFSGNANVPDLVNPCKCGWPTSDDYEQIEHNGIKYCVKEHNACENNDELYITIQYSRIQGQITVPRCVYLASECDKIKKQEK